MKHLRHDIVNLTWDLSQIMDDVNQVAFLVGQWFIENELYTKSYTEVWAKWSKNELWDILWYSNNDYASEIQLPKET